MTSNQEKKLKSMGKKAALKTRVAEISALIVELEEQRSEEMKKLRPERRNEYLEAQIAKIDDEIVRLEGREIELVAELQQSEAVPI